ncbi:MAG TPA: tRNA (guanosine(37)-N1)-methyltransferase TrmD [Actinopolymorphaceae bacterium]
MPPSVLRIDAVTIFPAYLEPLRLSLLGRAADAGLVDLRVHDLRDWTDDRHRTVDDTPAGGGAGMVMKPEPWAAAIAGLLARDGDTGPSRPLLVVPTPSGNPFTQRDAEAWAARSHLLIACGRYEGIDARVVDWARDDLDVDVAEVSIGDYVLAGGEVAAMVMIEAVTRLLPGVLGNPESLTEESHGDNGPGLLEYPVYTKPRDWNGRAVPDVLLSGDHGAVTRWRRDQSLLRTSQRRPELLAALPAGSLSTRDLSFLAEHGYPVAHQA